VSDIFAMIPPQIQVGAGQHTVQVQQVDRGDFLQVYLVSHQNVHAAREFHTTGELQDELMPWIAEQGHKVGEKLDREAKQELRRAGYKV